MFCSSRPHLLHNTALNASHSTNLFLNNHLFKSSRTSFSISPNHRDTMAGGKGKSIGGKAGGAKDSAAKSQKSHSAKAGLQVRRTKSHMLALSRSTSDVSLRQHFRPFRAQKTKMTRFFQLNQIAPLQGVMPGILLESHNALANVVAVTK